MDTILLQKNVVGDLVGGNHKHATAAQVHIIIHIAARHGQPGSSYYCGAARSDVCVRAVPGEAGHICPSQAPGRP